MSSVTQIAQAFHAVFDHADALARQTGFVQRERAGKITGTRFVITLVLGLWQRGSVTMSDLSHFARHSGMCISAVGFHERCTQAAAAFLHALLNLAFTQMVVADPVAMPLLRRVQSVIVEDSSTFGLRDECQGWWHRCGGRSRTGLLSAFKIQVRWDLLTGGLEGLALQDGPTPDTRSPLKGQRPAAGSHECANRGFGLL